MSWNIYLYDDHGDRDYEASYTHNVNGMIAAAYQAETGEATEQCGGPLGKAIGPAWWDRLDGATGQVGRVYLETILRGLTADPARYRAMNPESGWGDYDSLVALLRKAVTVVPDGPCVWKATG